MSCVLVLCVLLLVSQVEMIPVDTAKLPSSESQVDLVTPKSLDLALANQGVKPTAGLLTRLKRFIDPGENKCPMNMTEMWAGGPCVTCEKYMEYQDTDECPGY